MFLPSEQSFIVSKFIGLEKKNIKQLIFFKCKTVINLVIKNGCLKKRLLILMLVWVFDYGTMGPQLFETERSQHAETFGINK